MPKVSKIQVAQTRPDRARPPEKKVDKYICYRCGKVYERQKNNFPTSHSPLFLGADGYLPICKTCLDDLFEHYKEVLGNDKEAARRICMKFDIYWNPHVFDMVKKVNSSTSRMRNYISKTNLIAYINKCFDDTLDEEYLAAKEEAEMKEEEERKKKTTLSMPDVIQSTDPSEDSTPVIEIEPPTIETIEFWGPGFTPEVYYDLNRRYEKWTADEIKPMASNTEALYKQICLSEVKINMDFAAGNSVAAAQKSITDILGALNRKPAQVKDESGDDLFDQTPFGVMIKIKEDVAPIPEPLEEFKDVDGIKKYITVWFFGHICKMLHIKNSYCEAYEEEMNRLKVSRPDMDDDEDEGTFTDIFDSHQEEDDS